MQMMTCPLAKYKKDLQRIRDTNAGYEQELPSVAFVHLVGMNECWRANVVSYFSTVF